MKSRVSRIPVGLDTRKHQVREGDEAAALQYSNGDNVHSGLEDAAADRFPKVEVSHSGASSPARRPRREHQEGIRRPNRSILPVRQEPEVCGPKENERCHESLDCPGTCNHGADGRRIIKKKAGIQASSGTEEPSRPPDPPKGGKDNGDGSIPESKATKQRECFLDQNRWCNADCAAYVQGLIEPCKLLDLVNLLRIVHRQPRPMAPIATQR